MYKFSQSFSKLENILQTFWRRIFIDNFGNMLKSTVMFSTGSFRKAHSHHQLMFTPDHRKCILIKRYELERIAFQFGMSLLEPYLVWSLLHKHSFKANPPCSTFGVSTGLFSSYYLNAVEFADDTVLPYPLDERISGAVVGDGQAQGVVRFGYLNFLRSA